MERKERERERIEKEKGERKKGKYGERRARDVKSGKEKD